MMVGRPRNADRPPSLIEAIDGAARDLLARIKGDVAVEELARLPPISDQVRVFEATVEWAEKRVKLSPKDKKGPNLADLRAKYANGRAASSRGIQADPAEDAAADPAEQ